MFLNRIAKVNKHVLYNLVCVKVLLLLWNGSRRGHFIDWNVRYFINAGSRGDDILKFRVWYFAFGILFYHRITLGFRMSHVLGYTASSCYHITMAKAKWSTPVTILRPAETTLGSWLLPIFDHKCLYIFAWVYPAREDVQYFNDINSRCLFSDASPSPQRMYPEWSTRTSGKLKSIHYNTVACLCTT